MPCPELTRPLRPWVVYSILGMARGAPGYPGLREGEARGGRLQKDIWPLEGRLQGEAAGRGPVGPCPGFGSEEAGTPPPRASLFRHRERELQVLAGGFCLFAFQTKIHLSPVSPGQETGFTKGVLISRSFLESNATA